jgi:hypothetical protein
LSVVQPDHHLLECPSQCIRHNELEASNIVLWEPTQGKACRGSQKITYVDMLRRISGFETDGELRYLIKGTCRFHLMINIYLQQWETILANWTSFKCNTITEGLLQVYLQDTTTLH